MEKTSFISKRKQVVGKLLRNKSKTNKLWREVSDTLWYSSAAHEQINFAQLCALFGRKLDSAIIRIGLHWLVCSKFNFNNLLLLNFKNFFPWNLFFIFIDTDSMCICLDDDLVNLVKPERRNIWETESSKWFVKDHNNAWDLRKPGKMKLEWSTSDGGIIW